MCTLKEYSCGATAKATGGCASILNFVFFPLISRFSNEAELFQIGKPAMPSSKRQWYIYPSMIVLEGIQGRKISLTMPVQMYALWM